MDGPGFAIRQGREIFSSPKPSRLTLGSIQPHIQWAPLFFRTEGGGVKLPGFCIVDGYCCRVVDRHYIFPFCTTAVCTVCKS